MWAGFTPIHVRMTLILSPSSTFFSKIVLKPHCVASLPCSTHKGQGCVLVCSCRAGTHSSSPRVGPGTALVCDRMPVEPLSHSWELKLGEPLSDGRTQPRPPLDLLQSFLLPPTSPQSWEGAARWGQDGGRGYCIEGSCRALTTLDLCMAVLDA